MNDYSHFVIATAEVVTPVSGPRRGLAVTSPYCAACSNAAIPKAVPLRVSLFSMSKQCAPVARPMPRQYFGHLPGLGLSEQCLASHLAIYFL